MRSVVNAKDLNTCLPIIFYMNSPPILNKCSNFSMLANQLQENRFLVETRCLIQPEIASSGTSDFKDTELKIVKSV